MVAISNNEIARAIYLFLKDNSLETQPSNQDETSKYAKIVRFLFRRHLLSQAANILLQLEKVINQAENKIVVRVSSAEKLEEKTKEYLTQNLKKRYSRKEVPKEIILVEKLDKNLLGGTRLEINDEVIDLSIKNKMEKLKEYLLKSSESH